MTNDSAGVQSDVDELYGVTGQLLGIGVWVSEVQEILL